ncbi:MAG: response regulator [Roseiflexaceae bacterium]
METPVRAQLLLADDHAIVRAGIANAIREIPGVQIVGEVGDGPSLMAALATTRLDGLLIDVSMPDFEPLSGITAIRARYPQLKILVISAYDDDIYVQGLLAAGVDGYHLKDQSLSDLRLAVQRVLAGERWLASPLVSKLLSKRETPPVTTLTGRQLDMLRALQQGLDNQAIAHQIGLSVKTVENHLTRLYRQIGVQSRLEAVHYVNQHPDILGTPSRGFVPHAPASHPHDRVRAAITLLLVDDNPRFRNQLRRMVGNVAPQADIYEAENIREALRQARDLAPQLILVDVVLGDEDGIRLTRQLKQHDPHARIVLISAYPDREFHRLGIEAGAVALLDKKDLDAAALRQLIDDVAIG